MRRNFHILTFGCQMNVNDSDWLRRSLLERGFEEAPLGQATLSILNTCSVREKPEHKVYSALSRIRHASRAVPGAFAAVTGCVAQQLGTAFFDRFAHVRLVAGGDGLIAVPDAVERLFAEPDLKISLVDFSEHYPERPLALSGASTHPVQPVAYINIMQGCNNHCAYCIVPYTRGRQKSRTTHAVLDECRALLEHGAKELTLLGQNVNAFGKDNASDTTSFATLLYKVASLGPERLRFITAHPKDFSKESICAFAAIDCLCPRVHLPVQAGADAVLERMGRRYTRTDYLHLVRALREVRPDMALSTDIIVGFPGETEAHFQETLSLVEEVRFISSFSFCYSDRPGTRATLLPDKVPHEVKLERLQRLQAAQDTITQGLLAVRVSNTTRILLENTSRKTTPDNHPDNHQPEHQLEHWHGRDPYGVSVNIALPQGQGAPGQTYTVRITEAKRHTLVACHAGQENPA